MTVASTSYEAVLLALKVAFLILLYLFVWRIVRTAATDMRLPQESFILQPALAGGLRDAPPPAVAGRLVVVHSGVLEEGEEFELEAAPLTIGRGG